LIRHALSASLLLGFLVVSCGRTGLWTREPCSNEGATVACEDACGEGEVTCRQGYWSDCVVPETTRDCENDCGEGTQVCKSGAWQACEVAPKQRSCKGTCGTGSETCANGRWGSCEIPPVDLPCSNTCGDGLQHCENERLGRCEVPIATRDCASGCGPGHETCSNGAWGACDAPQPNPPVLHALIRDFQPATNPDFEWDLHGMPGDDRKIVKDILGADGKPEYSGDPSIHTITSAYTFYQWYHDSPVSRDIPIDISLTPDSFRPGFFVYDNRAFFPIDNDPRGWGNDGLGHDFHFTLEAHLTFRYVGGEVFGFSGDDDMWVFINRHLAINLGGLHQSESSTVSLDSAAGMLAIERGAIYPIDIFFAERHTIDSDFTLETSVADQGSCP
jgi:fibro-slime domain-containing protein